MSTFSVKLSGTLNKTVSSSTQISYVLEKLVTCTKETIMTFVVPEGTPESYVMVNLDPFIVQTGATKLLYVETDKRITMKCNVGACTGTAPSSGEVIDFHGVNIDTYMLITGDIKNLYFNRIEGDVDSANVTVRLWG